ncbi:MAG TPA: hypothetical protein VFY50_00275 [Candidatus Nitrosocosmicus sp.]|nr:hypothetical protein [Candidatus Nitrosocosmicus sp.]
MAQMKMNEERRRRRRRRNASGPKGYFFRHLKAKNLKWMKESNLNLERF